jgi:hypothetical protein
MANTQAMADRLSSSKDVADRQSSPFDARLGTHKIHRLSARNGTLKNYWWYADAFGKGS